MRNILKNRKALSTVVTTLIILVVSVLLAGVVTYFAINTTSTRVQEESLNIIYGHVWYSTAVGEGAVAAVVITNTGGRDVVLDKVAVRGQSVNWTTGYSKTGVTADVSYAWTPATYTAIAAGPLTLQSGASLALYFRNPDSISVNDIGLTVAISVFTSQAIYYKETNVEAV